MASDNDALLDWSSERPPLRPGDALTCTIGGVSARCVIVQVEDNKAILIPLQPSPEFDAQNDNLPTEAHAVTPDGFAMDAIIDSTVTLRALSVELRDDAAGSCNRQAFRIQVDFALEFSTDGIEWHKARGANISEGGLFAVYKEPVPLDEGQALFLHMHLPGMDVISAQAVVARVQSRAFFTGARATRIAVRFTDMPAHDARELSRFIFRYQVRNARYKIS